MFHNFSFPLNRIFLKIPAKGPHAVGLIEEDDREKKQDQTENLLQSKTRQEIESKIARAPVSPETRQLMREYLASENTERQDLVERFLRGEIASEEAFLKEKERLDAEEESWGTIFKTQREIRKRIQDLQWRTESYVELLPRQASKFELLLKDVRGINRQDKNTDRDLKNVLAPLTKATPPKIPQAFLDPEEAHEIYEVDPLRGNLEAVLKKYRSKIERAPNGTNIFKKILALKKEEARIEAQFKRLYNQMDQIIANNLDKVRRRSEEEKMLKSASKSIGITLKSGTEIEFTDPGLLALPGDKTSAKIKRVEFDYVVTRDHEGRVISKRPGFPFIHLSNGAKMPLGRFKKWVDAVDAVEKVSNLNDVAIRTGLAAYGIKIEKGMMLSYERRTVQNHESMRIPQHVQITDIKDGRIYFDNPVLFQPGFESIADDDMRESLTFGEFVKWWYRYEVEKSVGLQELQSLLKIHNELENKEFGMEAQDNPPILVKEGELLHYPDESGLLFRIQKIEPDGIMLDNGLKYTFPQFSYWVKNNHVEKVPEQEKTPQEIAEEQKRKREIEEGKLAEGIKKHIDEEAGHKHHIKALEHEKQREAGTPLQRLKHIWWSTQLLSFRDLWNMTLEVVEFVKRKHKRRSQGRFGDVGGRLPGILGTEFERIKQAAENEEVSKNKEAMEHWGIPQIQRTLHETNNKDVAKACIMTLVHKGEMRWDDHEMWETMNRLTARYTTRGAELYIPSPQYMPQGKNGEDMALKAIDALWGDGTGAEWFAENTSKYNSNKNNFEYKFKQLENDPKGIGGPAGACKRMLDDWEKGRYVNPQEYEEMVDAAIKYGKMGTEDKMFYIFAGVLLRKGNDPHGETLLHLDRIGELNSKYLNEFPMLDFFTQERKMDYTMWNEETGEYGKSRKLNLKDYEEWRDSYFPDDFERHKPGKQFSRFMWEVMMMSDATRTRISKGIRNAEKMDHDDAHVIISAASPTEVDNLLTGPSGQKKYFTNEGYMNAYPGFNQFIVSLSYSIEEEKDPDKVKYKVDALRDAINSFVRYDAILDNRLHKDKGLMYARLDERHYSRKTVVDKTGPLSEHQKQLQNLIVEIGQAYGQDFSFLYDPAERTGSMFDPKEVEKQKKYELRVDQLKDIIGGMIESDNGAKAMDVIRRARSRPKKVENALRGMESSQRPSAEELTELHKRAQEKARSRAGHAGH